jgi:hypothetical protein
MLKNAGEAARIGKDGLTDYGKRRVRGLEATLFTETVRDASRIDYLVMPRLLAVAERAWAADPAWALETDPARAAALHRRAWSGFVNALGQRVLPRLDLEQAGVAYRIAPPGLMLDGERCWSTTSCPASCSATPATAASPRRQQTGNGADPRARPDQGGGLRPQRPAWPGCKHRPPLKLYQLPYCFTTPRQKASAFLPRVVSPALAVAFAVVCTITSLSSGSTKIICP